MAKTSSMTQKKWVSNQATTKGKCMYVPMITLIQSSARTLCCFLLRSFVVNSLLVGTAMFRRFQINLYLEVFDANFAVKHLDK